MLQGIKNFFHNVGFETRRLVANGGYRSKAEGVSDRLLYARFVDEGIILNVDGSFMTSFWYKPNDLDAETEAIKDYVGCIVHKAFLGLDTGWCMHLDCIRTQSIGYVAQDECYFTNATAFSIDHERRMEYNREGKHYENEYVINFTYLPPGDLRSKFGALFHTEDNKDAFDYSIYLNQFKDTLYNVIDILTSSQFKISRMSDEEIFCYLFYCINGFHASVRLPVRHWTDLRFMLANQDLVTGSYPKVGELHMRTISMGEQFPLETYPTLLGALNHLGFEYRWSSRYIFLSVADGTKLLSKISELHYQKRKSAAGILSDRYGSGGKVNRSADRYANDAEEAISSIEMSDWRYGKYTSVIVLFDEDEELLDEKVKIVKSVIDNCGLAGKAEKINCFEAYLGSLPGMVYPNVRKWVMNSYNLADLLPTSSVWSGYKSNPCTYYKDNNPVLFYASTTGGTPFRGCLHVGDDGHALVIGANGSVVMNFLAAQQSRYKNSKIFVFDSSHSSLALTYSIPQSRHYDLGYSDSLSFQPLVYLDTQEDLTFAVEWLSLLCTVNGFVVKPLHISIISEVLEIVRKEANPSQRTLSYFYYLISSRNEELALQYKPYMSTTSSSLQSQIFDAKENHLTLTNFTVFEMNQLARKGDAILIPAVLYLFHMIERSLHGSPLNGSPVSIYIHDGSSIFKHKVFRSYLDDWLRKIASKNVQIIIGVHQPSDIIKSEIAEILMQSCKTKIFTANLNANGTQKPSYEALGLNERQISLISNAMVNQEYYFTNPLGSRLIQFNLGELARAFLYPQLDIEIMRKLKAQHKDLFGYHWILHNKLLPEMADYWLNVHNHFLKDGYVS